MMKRHISICILAAILAIHALAAVIVRNPTSNTTPDQGGTLAVTTPTNTGHAGSTITFAPGPGSASKSARWSGFQSVGGQIKSIKLKVDWEETGSLAVGGSNGFQLEYSTNNGVGWTAFPGFSHSAITSTVSGTAEVTLNNTQDLTQVQVRDLFSADAPTGSDSASVTITISNIRIEVTTVDAQLIIMK